MKNFFYTAKDNRLISIVLMCMFICIVSINTAVAQNYSKKVDDLDREIKELANKKKLKQKEIRKVESLLKKKETEIKGIKKRLSKVEKDAKGKKKKVANLTSLIKQDTGMVAKTEAEKEALVVKAYNLSQINYVKLLFSQNNPNTITRNGDYYNFLLKHKSDRLRQLEMSINGFHQDQKYLNKAIKELESVEKNYLTDMKKLKKANSDRQLLLAKLGKDVDSTAKQIKKLNADRERLRALIAELEKQKKKLKLPKYTPKQGSFAKQRSKLPYPVVGSIKNKFGKRISGSRLKSNGVTLNTKNNSPVRAIYDGQVIFAKSLKGFGNLIIVDHGDSYMSLYANNALLSRQEGDVVAAGDLVAKTGGDNNFYFELRHKGKPINPARWCK